MEQTITVKVTRMSPVPRWFNAYVGRTFTVTASKLHKHFYQVIEDGLPTTKLIPMQYAEVV